MAALTADTQLLSETLQVGGKRAEQRWRQTDEVLPAAAWAAAAAAAAGA